MNYDVLRVVEELEVRVTTKIKAEFGIQTYIFGCLINLVKTTTFR